jgi:hypothetical protein
MAVHCEECDTHFCGWCLSTCPDRDEAHNHVFSCKYNAANETGGVFADKDEFQRGTNHYKRDRLQKFLDDVEDENVLRELVKDIGDLMQEIK